MSRWLAPIRSIGARPRPPAPRGRQREPGRSSEWSTCGSASHRADLDDRAEKALVTVVKELRDNPGLTIDLEGTTDSRGTRDYNMQLSRRRVETVRRYLLTRGVDAQRIVHSSGVGPLRDDAVAEEDKRRVTVKLMTPS